MVDELLLRRITHDPQILGGKPVIRGHRLAVEHVLSMLAAGDSVDALLQGYPWLEVDDVLACLVYAKRLPSSPAPHRQRLANEAAHSALPMPPLEIMDQLIEDLADFRVVAERRGDETVSHREALAELRREGRS